MAMGLNLGNLLVHLRADDSNFTRIMGGAMRTMKRYAKYAAIAGMAQLTLSVRSYAKFEEQMSNVSTMLDEHTMKYMPAYEKAVKSMAMEFGEGTDTLSKGLYDILSASVAPAKALKVLQVSAKAAKAGMTSTAVAADAITTVLNSYGLAAEEAGRISDILFATVKRGKTTFAELAPNIGKVAAIAATANLSFEEVSAALATMTRAGLQADLATTSLRSIMNSFLKPTEDAAAMARQFGLELSSATLQSIGLTGVLKKLKNATAEQLAAIMPNVRGLAGFAAALKQAEEMADDLDLMLNSLGLTQIAYDKMTNTLMHTFRQFWQTIKMTSVTLGSYLEPAVKKATETMREWISVHQPEIGIVFVRTIKAMVESIQWLSKHLRALPMYWKQFSIEAYKAQIAIYKIADAMTNLDELFAWIRGDTGTYKEEVVRLQKEVDGLTTEVANLALGFVKSESGIDSFFNILIGGLEKAKKELEDDKALRDMRARWKNVYNELEKNKELIKDVAETNLEQTMKDITEATKEVAEQFGPFGKEIDRWGTKANDVWKRMGEGGARALDSISDTLTELVMKGKADFASLAKAILADLLQITIRWQMAQVMMGLMPGLPWGTTVAPISTGLTSPHGGPAAPTAMLGVQHGGEIAKTGWAVVHKGETYSGVNNEMGMGKPPNVIINNNTGQPMEQESTPSFDGENWVANIVIKKITSGGPMKDAIKGIRG